MHGPRTAVTAAGQGYLKARLKTERELDLRRRTALRDWVTVIIAVGLQQCTPVGVKLPALWFALLLGVALTGVFVSWFAYPRLTAPRFVRAESSMLTLAFAGVAMIVFATGGAESPYVLLFAPSMVYAAYFYARTPLSVAHIAIGSTAAILPIAYDHQTATAGGFLPTIAIALAVWWTICAAIAAHRRAALGAEHEARRLSLADALTHVANLRAIEEFAADLEAANTPFAMAIVDLDGLKKANSEGGHAAGDRLIRRLVHALRVASRDQDQVGRIGGDEFVVLMPHADKGVVAMWNARFEAALATDNLVSERHGRRLAASVGIAMSPTDGGDFDELKQTADLRMFRRKHESRLLRSTNYGLIGEMLADVKSFARARSGAVSSTSRGRFDWVRPPAMIPTALVAGFATWLVIGETGGPQSVLLPVVLLPVAYFTYFGDRIHALLGGAAVVAGFTTAFFGTGPIDAAAETTFITMMFAVIAIGVALHDNSRRLDRARREAATMALADPLSGAFNRRALEDDAEIAFDANLDELFRPAKAPVLLLADINDFKRANTLMGHHGGDRLIRDVADALTAAVERHGHVYRLGGDEFAMLLPAEKVCDAEPLALRCADMIAAVERDGGYTRHGVPVSASVGYSIWRPGMDVDRMLDEADRRMMAAKAAFEDGRRLIRQGGDRVFDTAV